MTRGPHDILQLGYLRIGVSGMDWWRRFAALVGYQLATGMGDELLLRADTQRDWRIAVHEAATPGVSAIGWEAASPSAMAAVRDRLIARGTHVTGASAQEKAQRKVEDMVVALDPDGLRHEIYWGPNTAMRQPFRSPTDTRFESGALGNGHVTVNVADAQATLDWCTEGLGLRLSDAAWMEGHDRVYFLRCNARHHSFAFAAMRQRPPGTVHVMSDLASLDDLGQARDRLLDAGLPLARDLGSHPLDGVVSFYVGTPDGFDFELATGTRRIDEETWASDRFQRTGRPWGHRKPPAAKDRA